MSRKAETDENKGILTAPYVLEYSYTRSTGPVLGRFLSGLRDKKIEGIRAANGRVLVPPVETDPVTGEELDEFVQVGEVGTVTACSWLAEPRAEHPLDKPFAWALVQLDGADTGLLHAVDCGSAEKIEVGSRVEVSWRDERHGFITDIECFRLVGD
jgi:uncharacterized OB-fold protein